MEELKKIREQIDAIDSMLVELFETRMESVLKVAEYKMKNNMEIFDNNREKQVIQKGVGRLKNGEFKEALEEFLNALMKVSKKTQHKILSSHDTLHKGLSAQLYAFREGTQPKLKDTDNLIIGFQGVSGSFSEQALFEYFGDSVHTKPVKEFEDIFVELKNDAIEYGVLPIENSSTGGVAEVYDLLNKYDFYIVGEICLKVDQHLMGITGTKIEDITEVYSHPQAFSQCMEYLRVQPDWRLIPYQNTAKSAEFVMKQNSKSIAAIGSSRAAQIYGLEILKDNINSNNTNTTRFVVVAKDMISDKSCNKISAVLSTAHKAGSLYNVLQYFAENNINLLKIESRPIVNKPWEYFFYIDFQGSLNDEKVKLAVQSIEENSHYFKLIGCYRGYSEKIL